ncbi:MAG: hypothetical protein HF314_14285 [Ignavibacteria bacterium]|jgi:hypothetical protein|nr:hypothetical protein [Ignavibacteria bacterium]MCU7504248.1 hypothetical protein [Ignavibacteria bacterium]MCU7516093.1 hypothetical protein [Ignavibacteria bacterium]
MELVPIIQISLALFSGLLLLVLLISYIVFKVNKNSQAAQTNQEYGRQMNNDYFPDMRQEQEYSQMASAYNAFSPYYSGQESQEFQQPQASPASRRENSSSRQNRYTVVYNEGTGEKTAYYPERSEEYKYRFAPTKNTNAFAPFK